MKVTGAEIVAVVVVGLCFLWRLAGALWDHAEYQRAARGQEGSDQ